MKKKSILITAAVFIVAVILVLLAVSPNEELVLTDADTGKKIASYPFDESGQFAVTFVHSVNKSPVTDIYENVDGEIYLTGTVYYGFGAGVPTELYGHETFSFGEKGELIISDMDTWIPSLTYVVGTVSDHTLYIGNPTLTGGQDGQADEEEISLRDLCGRNTSVKFTIEKTLF